MGDRCRKCGCSEFRYEEKGPHIGAYCSDCNSWVKWVSQKTKTSKRAPTVVINFDLEEEIPDADCPF